MHLSSLPPELTSYIILLAASSVYRPLSEKSLTTHPNESRQRNSVHLVLQLAAVNAAAYETVLGQLILPELTLTGPEQLEAFCVSIGKTKLLRRLVSTKVKRLSIIQRSFLDVGHSQSGTGSTASVQPRRRGLYDPLIEESKFDKAICVPLQSLVIPLTQNLEALHLDTLPSILRSPTPASFNILPSQRLQEVSFTLTTWGRIGVEDIFVGASTKTTTSPNQEYSRRSPQDPERSLVTSPWMKLERVQIHGRAGFRFSLASASALGSLPVLKHLGLVMPNFVRDAGMTRFQRHTGGVVAPAALQLLILLLTGRLQTLVVIGHNMEGWLGCTAGYRAWLKSIRCANDSDIVYGTDLEGKQATSRLNIQLVTARIAPGGSFKDRQANDPLLSRLVSAASIERLEHPNFFSGWMVRRSAEKTHWNWECAAEGFDESSEDNYEAVTCADHQMQVEWKCEAWEVPIAEDSPQTETMEISAAAEQQFIASTEAEHASL